MKQNIKRIKRTIDTVALVTSQHHVAITPHVQ